MSDRYYIECEACGTIEYGTPFGQNWFDDPSAASWYAGFHSGHEHPDDFQMADVERQSPETTTMPDEPHFTITVESDEFGDAIRNVAEAAEEFRDALKRFEETSITMHDPRGGEPHEIPATDLVGIEASLDIETADILSAGDIGE